MIRIKYQNYKSWHYNPTLSTKEGNFIIKLTKNDTFTVFMYK